MRSESNPTSSSATRRVALKAAVWSVPIIATVVAVPAQAASAVPPAVARLTGIQVEILFSALTEQGTWQSGTGITVTVRPSPDGFPALALASDTPALTADVTQFTQDVTFPFQVNWTASPGWTISTILDGPGQWTYRFTPGPLVLPTPSNIEVATPSTELARSPATTLNSVPQGSWQGDVVTSTAIGSGFAFDGKQILGVPIPIPFSAVRRYTVRYPDPFGDVPVNADGSTTLTFTPLG